MCGIKVEIGKKVLVTVAMIASCHYYTKDMTLVKGNLAHKKTSC